MREVGNLAPAVAAPTPDDLPVESMDYTLADHYRDSEERLAIEDERQFDGDLRTLFSSSEESPQGELAADFLRRHRREIVGRIAYWTGESALIVRQFVDFLAARAASLALRARGLEASTLIELTAFGTAVIMNYRYTDALDGTPTTNTV